MTSESLCRDGTSGPDLSAEAFLREGFEDLLVSLRDLGNPLCLHLMEELYQAMLRRSSSYSSLLTKSEEYIWEEIHSVYWKDVSPSLRDAYSLISVLIVQNMRHRSPLDIPAMIRRADMGILLGSAMFREHLQHLINDLSVARKLPDTGKESPIEMNKSHKRQRLHSPIVDRIDPCSSTAVMRVPDVISVEEFVRQHLNLNAPLIMERAVDDWPAVSRWRSLEYFKESIVL